MAARRKLQPEPSFRVRRTEASDDVAEIRLEGSLKLAEGGRLWDELHSKASASGGTNVRFDLSGIESIDGGAMALLVQARWDLQAAGRPCEFTGGSGKVKTLLALYEGDEGPAPRPGIPRIGLFGRVGDRVFAGLLEVQSFLAFVGGMVLAFGGILRRPRTANWRDVSPIMTRTGVDALPIVLLVAFLIGLVAAFQSAVQLRKFGANIFVADLVALAMTRELGPLMTSIIVCGRSGAAFAAELGTMKVSEEIDALRTMGLSPLAFLAFPRILALVLMVPLLTLMSDVIGIGGGALVGVVNLDLTTTSYAREAHGALAPWDVYQGVIKAGVFGLAIGIISCAQGLAASGGAEGVGRRTTSAVVASLFALILLDACFTFAFHQLGL